MRVFINQVRNIRSVLVIQILLFLGVHLFMIGSDLHFYGKRLKYTLIDIVSSDMQNIIPQGSLAITKRINANDLKVGDDITFFVDIWTLETQRIVKIVNNNNKYEPIYFQTKGLNKNKSEDSIVGEADIIGRVIFHIPKLGAIRCFMNEHKLDEHASLMLAFLVIFHLIILVTHTIILIAKRLCHIYSYKKDYIEHPDRTSKPKKTFGEYLFCELFTKEDEPKSISDINYIELLLITMYLYFVIYSINEMSIRYA